MIGILDSGLGGIATYEYLRERHPGTSFIVLADQANAPYGEKSEAELKGLTRRNIAWLLGQGADDIIVACNTICSTVLEDLRPEFPEARLTNIVRALLAELRPADIHNVVILGTRLCIASGAYERGLRKKFPEAAVYAQAAADLVPLIEGGAAEELLREALHRYLDKYRGKASEILLGCTHYPLLSGLIREILPAKQFDSNAAVERRLAFPDAAAPRRLIYTSGDSRETERQLIRCFGDRATEVRKIG